MTTIRGMEELRAAFLRLQNEVAEQALTQAVQAGALPVERTAKQLVRKRTRTLARSIHTEIGESRRDYVEALIGTNLEYAAIHEFGGTIKPRTAKYLSIPLTEDARRQAGGPRDFRGKLSVRMRRGAARGVLVDEQGTAQYALTRSVTISAQPYLRPALDTRGGDAEREIGATLVKLILEATNG